MSRSINVGVGNTARHVPKLYLGIENTARRVRKGYIGVGGIARLFYYPVSRPSRLPDGYTELEYICSTAGQYISTGIYPVRELTEANINSKRLAYKVELEAQVFAEAVSKGGNIINYYGLKAFENWSYSCYFSLYANSAGNMSYTTGIRHETNGTASSRQTTVTIATGFTDRFTVSMDVEGSLSINGIEYTNQSILQDYNESGSSISIGGEGGDLGLKLYACKMYNKAGELLRDFVPCRNILGRIGMYDLVSGALFTSASKTEFLAGAAI